MFKTPVHIISGFLGSGKTTAIIRLLQHKNTDENWAIVVNEFGKISIDGQTLQEKSAKGSVFDISGGCICCSARGYLNENLEKIIETGTYDRIIIEPSGLGGIDIVSEIVDSKPRLLLMPVICLVDITAIENQRLQMNFIYKSQISRADWIVFSKCDLLPDTGQQDKLIGKFKFAFPEKQHLLIGENLTPALFDFDFGNRESQNVQFIYAAGQHLLNKNFEEKYFRFEGNILFDSQKLTGYFNEQQSIVRAKGHIQTETGWKLVNFTLSGSSIEPCQQKNQAELVIIAEKSDLNPFPDFQDIMKTLLIL